MMKKTLFILLLSVITIISSCVEDKNIYEGSIPDVPLENYKMTKDFQVPVQDGHNTIVTYGDQVLFEGNYPVTIQVPKFDMNATRSAGLDWHFEVYDKPEKKFKKDISGVLMFEDIIDGDNDYNDFVCHIELKNVMGDVEGSGKLVRLQMPNIKIQPQAMGNMLPLKFGMEIVDKASGEIIDDIIFYEDIRKECFGGIDGFINTSDVVMDGKDSSKRPKSARDYGKKEDYPLPDMLVDNLAINFYIIVKGVKHYTAESNKVLPTANNTPYGLFIPLIESFKYPKETISMFDAYPNFGKWLKGEIANPFSGFKGEFLYER